MGGHGPSAFIGFPMPCRDGPPLDAIADVVLTKMGCEERSLLTWSLMTQASNLCELQQRFRPRIIGQQEMRLWKAAAGAFRKQGK